MLEPGRCCPGWVWGLWAGAGSRAGAWGVRGDAGGGPLPLLHVVAPWLFSGGSSLAVPPCSCPQLEQGRQRQPGCPPHHLSEPPQNRQGWETSDGCVVCMHPAQKGELALPWWPQEGGGHCPQRSLSSLCPLGGGRAPGAGHGVHRCLPRLLGLRPETWGEHGHVRGGGEHRAPRAAPGLWVSTAPCWDPLCVPPCGDGLWGDGMGPWTLTGSPAAQGGQGLGDWGHASSTPPCCCGPGSLHARTLPPSDPKHGESSLHPPTSGQNLHPQPLKIAPAPGTCAVTLCRCGAGRARPGPPSVWMEVSGPGCGRQAASS